MAKEKFIIIDGNALLHRSFHALPPLTTKKGEMINAVYGFTMTLIKAIKELNPKYIAVTFDKADPTFRHEMYGKYKGTRIKAEGIEELYKQLPGVKEILEAFHIPVYEKSGYEADDIIGTIAKKLEIGNGQPKNEQLEIIIVTGDLDTLQLIGPATRVYTLKKGLSETIIYNEEMVEERYEGLTPEQLVDYRALKGDPSDNIPGVKGIGEKSAIKLMKQFGSLENLYDKLEKSEDYLPAKQANNLLKYKDDAFLSKRLSRIDQNVPFLFNFKECEWKDYDEKRTFHLFQEFEFTSLLNKLPKNPKKEIKTTQTKVGKVNYKLIETEKELKELMEKLHRQELIVIDTETTSADPVKCTLVGISFCWREGEAYYIPIFNFQSLDKLPPIRSRAAKGFADGARAGGTSFSIFNKLREVLEDPKIKKCGHNIKYDYIALAVCGIELKGIYFDTMISSYLLNPGSRRHGLNDLVFTETGHQMIPIEDLIGKGKDQITINKVNTKKVCEYSCEDADWTLRLMQKLNPRLVQQHSLKIFNEIEIPLIPVLAGMEMNGVRIDIKLLNKLDKNLGIAKKNLEQKIYKIAGYEFNIASPIQLKEALFDKIGISTKNLKKGKTGISTAAHELEKMRGLHPIINLISEYREITKLISTYIETLPKLVYPKTGRIHASFNQTITATGRLSSSDPNLQNIPIRTELGKSIRKAFVAENEFKLLSADYSQIELRIVAAMSKDEKMINAFQEGKDIHAITASAIFKVKPEEVTSSMRNRAKAVNFGIMYGMGPRGLADAAKTSFEEAQNFIDEYFLLYKGVKKFIDESLKKAQKCGYAETFFGRRRYLPELASGSPVLRNAAERMAINHPIQGTCADLIKLAMIRIHQRIMEGIKLNGKIAGNEEIKLILQIHDELVFEIKNELIEKAAEIIRREMENVVEFPAPIKVDINVGDNWGEI